MADMTVPTTILQQLGGHRFKVMTGAKDFIGGNDTLTFKVPTTDRDHKRIFAVRIKLDPSDTYTVEFLRKRGRFDIEVASTFSDIYFDQLQQLFTKETGYATHL